MKKRKRLLFIALLFVFLGINGYQEKVQAVSTEILYVVDCEEWISLRSSASTSASKLKEIPLGASCEYLGTASNGFYKVRYNGTVGYALSQYLSKEKDQIVSVEEGAELLFVVGCDEWISLRASASTSAKKLKEIPLGASCEYLASANNGFYKINYNGTTGYALSQYLDTLQSDDGLKEKLICVTDIQGRYIYYYNCILDPNVPEIQGKEKKIKLSDKIKYYCKTDNSFDNGYFESEKVSKKKFIKRLNRLECYSEGIYVVATFEDNECIRVFEPYWT